MKTQLFQHVLISFTTLFSVAFTHAQTMEKIFEMKTKLYGYNEVSEHAMARYYIEMAEELVYRAHLKEANQQASAEEIRLKRELENALEPVFKFKRLIDETGHSEEKSRQMFQLRQDPAIARAVFDVLGPKRAHQYLQQRVAAIVGARLRASQLNAHGPISLLLDERFANAIGLSETQQARIKTLTEEVETKLRIGPGKEFSDLENLTRRHWSTIKKELKPEQRKQAEELVGEPSHWYRSTSQLLFRGRDGHFMLISTHDDKAVTLAQRLGKTIEQLTIEELEEDGFAAFHSHQYGLLLSSFVWDELEFSDSQRKQFREDFAAHKLDNRFVVNLQHKQRLDEIIAGDSQLPKYISRHLNERQQNWFKNIEFQVLTGKFESSFGLLHPDVRKLLELSNSQVATIENLSKQFEKQYALLEEVLAKHRVEIQAEFTKDIARILTDKQHDLYVQYTGKSLKLDEE